MNPGSWALVTDARRVAWSHAQTFAATLARVMTIVHALAALWRV